MKVSETGLHDCLLIEPEIFNDKRGFFLETFQKNRYKDIAGIDLEFVQDNCSRSTQGTLRGMHFQKNNPQGKLVRVSRGSIFDVAIDIRPDSHSFGEWVGEELNELNQKQLWVPPGFAHGFLVLSPEAHVEYKCTTYYDPADEQSILWSDKNLNISWPGGLEIITSPKDAQALCLEEISL